jgi:hypothetical protein
MAKTKIDPQDVRRKFVFASGTSYRKVTIHTKPSEAIAKAAEILDRRCEISGSEPPVSWALYEIKEKKKVAKKSENWQC